MDNVHTVDCCPLHVVLLFMCACVISNINEGGYNISLIPGHLWENGTRDGLEAIARQAGLIPVSKIVHMVSCA